MMPVRDGRWISFSTLAKLGVAAKAAAEAAAPDEPATQNEPTQKRTRRSRKAVEAAILDATGIEVEVA